jgi:hypothetical protein
MSSLRLWTTVVPFSLLLVSQTSSSQAAPAREAPARTCCKVCTTGCPCGNSCISCKRVCHKPPGCACPG